MNLFLVCGKRKSTSSLFLPIKREQWYRKSRYRKKESMSLMDFIQHSNTVMFQILYMVDKARMRQAW